MRVSRWTLLWVLAVGVLAAIELGVLTGLINATNLIASFFTFIVALVVVSILSIIGAVFVTSSPNTSTASASSIS